jgi:hypothetical protein
MPSRRTIALLLSPIGLLLISATRLIIISDYNTTTATTVASSGGYVNTLLGTAIPLVPVFLPYLSVLLLLFRRYVLSILALAATAFISPTMLSVPDSHRKAVAEGHLILAVVNNNLLTTVFLASLLITLIGIVGIYLNDYEYVGRVISSILAILAAAALTPYLYNLYPVPHSGSYYAITARQPWLPAESISLKSGEVYYGWVLSADQDWFTVLLLSSRTIRYIHTDEVVTRTVCQQSEAYELRNYLPLIPLLHTTPAKIPLCLNRDSVATKTQRPSKKGEKPKTRVSPLKSKLYYPGTVQPYRQHSLPQRRAGHRRRRNAVRCSCPCLLHPVRRRNFQAQRPMRTVPTARIYIDQRQLPVRWHRVSYQHRAVHSGVAWHNESRPSVAPIRKKSGSAGWPG